MTIILSSDFPLDGNERVADYIHETIKKPDLSVAFISPLVNPGGYEEFKRHFSEYGLKNISYLILNANGDLPAETDLTDYDVFYLHGGDPRTIGLSLQSSDLIKTLLALEGKERILIGTSGSAMALSGSLSLLYALYPKAQKGDTEEPDETMEHFRVVPFTILPHYSRYQKKSFIKAIKQFTIDHNEQVYALFDGSAMVYDGRESTPLGEVAIFEGGEERTP